MSEETPTYPDDRKPSQEIGESNPRREHWLEIERNLPTLTNRELSNALALEKAGKAVILVELNRVAAQLSEARAQARADAAFAVDGYRQALDAQTCAACGQVADGKTAGVYMCAPCFAAQGYARNSALLVSACRLTVSQFAIADGIAAREDVRPNWWGVFSSAARASRNAIAKYEAGAK